MARGDVTTAQRGILEAVAERGGEMVLHRYVNRAAVGALVRSGLVRRWNREVKATVRRARTFGAEGAVQLPSTEPMIGLTPAGRTWLEERAAAAAGKAVA